MPEDRTVLDHLLEGRNALEREVARLTAAIEQLDSVLGRLGTNVARSSDPAPAASAEPVNPPADAPPVEVPPVEVARAAPAEVAAPRARAARKAPTAKNARSRRTDPTSQPPKSIRVHVLEMLAAENREFGLAEIIDRIHDAGIQAHDDAVRSITIKLMKDGRVERVGRGQYRLARRGSSTPPPTETRHTAPAPAPAQSTTQATVSELAVAAPAPSMPAPSVPGPADVSVHRSAVSVDASDAPSLNLGQPWTR